MPWQMPPLLVEVDIIPSSMGGHSKVTPSKSTPKVAISGSKVCVYVFPGLSRVLNAGSPQLVVWIADFVI